MTILPLQEPGGHGRREHRPRVPGQGGEGLRVPGSQEQGRVLRDQRHRSGVSPARHAVAGQPGLRVVTNSQSMNATSLRQFMSV